MYFWTRARHRAVDLSTRALDIGLPIVWMGLAIALLMWASAYIVVRAIHGWPSSFWAILGYVFAFAVSFAVMFFGEGTEIVIAMLRDKHEDQVPDMLRKVFANFRASSQTQFISGRQFLIVLAIVGMTLLCENVSDISVANADAPPFVQWLGSGAVREWFKFVFPLFFALWFAQVPPKLIAHESPLWAYSWTLTRATIRASMFLGRTLRFAGPSIRFTNVLLHWLPPATDALKPSREHYYTTSATLRDGKAVESLRTEIEIGPAGEITVDQWFRFRAYAAGFNQMSQRVGWEAKITNARCDVIDCPVDYIVQPPKFESKMKGGYLLHYYAWAVRLTDDLPFQKSFTVHVSYTTAAGAVSSRLNTSDFYQYTVARVPTAELVILVKPKPFAGFVLMNPKATAKASDAEAVNRKETSRITKVRVDGGFEWTAPYPLPSTEFKYAWTLMPASCAWPNTAGAAMKRTIGKRTSDKRSPGAGHRDGGEPARRYRTSIRRRNPPASA